MLATRFHEVHCRGEEGVGRGSYFMGYRSAAQQVIIQVIVQVNGAQVLRGTRTEQS